MLVLVPTPFEAQLLTGDTAASQLRGDTQAQVRLGQLSVTLALTGFGLAAAGAGASFAMARARKDAASPVVVLVGLAGSYRPEVLPVGTALFATGTSCDGIGIGCGPNFQTASDSGWGQALPTAYRPMEYDYLTLFAPDIGMTSIIRGDVTSVTSASTTPEEVAAKQKRYPNALAEEMESFAVALAARLAGCQLAVIRGISNIAGNRDKSSWRCEEAMTAVVALLNRLSSVIERQL